MIDEEKLKRDILRNVSLCQILEPLAEKKDCTTRTVDSSLGTKLEYFLISGLNSCWPFYDLADEILRRGRQPDCIYSYAHEAQVSSARNRGGGKVNFGQTALLIPLVTAQVLEYVEGREDADARDICRRSTEVLRNTTSEDVAYFKEFLSVAVQQSADHHYRADGTRKEPKRTEFTQNNILEVTQDNSRIHISSEMANGYPFSLEILDSLKRKMDKGILRASEEIYGEMYTKRIKRYDAVADLFVSAFYLMFATHRTEVLLP